MTTPLRFPNTRLIIMPRDGAIIFGDLIGSGLNMAVRNTAQTLRFRLATVPTGYPNQTTLEITGSRLRRSRTVRHLHLGTAKAHLRSLSFP